MERPTTSQTTMLVAALLLVSGLGIWFFSRGYGEVSGRGYEYAVALFRACNQKDLETLRKISQMVDESARAGDLGPKETKWLQAIIEKGQLDDWEAASSDVRRLMHDQLKAAPPMQE